MPSRRLLKAPRSAARWQSFRRMEPRPRFSVCPTGRADSVPSRLKRPQEDMRTHRVPHLAAMMSLGSHLPWFPDIKRLCCGGQSGKDGSWRGGFGLFPPAPRLRRSLGGRHCGGGGAGRPRRPRWSNRSHSQGPKRSSDLFGNMVPSARFFPRKRSRVVTRAILAVFIFEVGPELAVALIQWYVAGTEPIMPKVFALAAFLGFFSWVL